MKQNIFSNQMNDLNQGKNFLFLLSITILLGACKDADLPKLQGRYQGIQTTGAQKIQIIAQVPEFSTVGDTKVSIFKIYPTLATAPGDQISIVIFDNKSLELKMPQLPLSGVRLSPNNNCANGSIGSLDVSVCWSEGKLEWILNDKSEPDKSMTINLVRDDTLPPFDKDNNRTYSLEELIGRAKYINYTVTQEG